MGYSGTPGECEGSPCLWQLGGGQNTIGNEGPPAYPVGEVVFDVADDAWTVLAEGTLTVPGDASGTIVLSVVCVVNALIISTICC